MDTLRSVVSAALPLSTGMMGADDKVTITHNELTGQSDEMNQALAQIYASHCAGRASRQFDFWAGDWDVFDTGSPIKVAQP
ncbi:MAG: hypothetical protein WCA20_34740 [Candidatus Sulfotelmatobacter sp.]